MKLESETRGKEGGIAPVILAVTNLGPGSPAVDRNKSASENVISDSQGTVGGDGRGPTPLGEQRATGTRLGSRPRQSGTRVTERVSPTAMKYPVKTISQEGCLESNSRHLVSRLEPICWQLRTLSCVLQFDASKKYRATVLIAPSR